MRTNCGEAALYTTKNWTGKILPDLDVERGFKFPEPGIQSMRAAKLCIVSIIRTAMGG